MKIEEEKDFLRDGYMKSLWQQDVNLKRAESELRTDQTFDAVIIGGGLTGITTALLLQLEGKSV